MSQQLLAPSRAAVHTGLVLWCVERRPTVQIIVVDVRRYDDPKLTPLTRHLQAGLQRTPRADDVIVTNPEPVKGHGHTRSAELARCSDTGMTAGD